MDNQQREGMPTQIEVYRIASDILAQLPGCTSSCDATIRSFAQAHHHLRQHLQHRIHTRQQAAVQPLCAIDGTHAVIETSGVTFLLLVAVAVRETVLVDQRTRVVTLPPLADAEQLAGDLRTRLELAVLADQIRTDSTTLHLLDGSLVTVYLALRRLLRQQRYDQMRQRQNWWNRVANLLERSDLAADWSTVLQSQQVIAHAKHSSSNREQQVARDALLSNDLCSDAVLWSLVLHPDEFSTPMRLPTGRVALSAPFWGFSDGERQAIGSAYQNWSLLYARLRRQGGAMHLEMPTLSSEQMMRQLATLSNGLAISEIMEPVPQYLADALCKAQQPVLHALVNGIHNGLRRDWENDIVNLWLGNWRTG
jgi:hypothetical protein